MYSLVNVLHALLVISVLIRILALIIKFHGQYWKDAVKNNSDPTSVPV